MSEKKIIKIDGLDYHLDIYKRCSENRDAPRLIIVSYQPNKTASNILKYCLNSIKKYTPEPHELWVVDNSSPKENVSWLLKYPNINIVLNHNKYIKNGSYDNGIALEIAKNIIDADSNFFMSLHMDIMVCREGWLSYLLSKFNHEMRAAGVRMDTYRVPEGVLHILGAIFDFQLIRKLNLSFMPQLPKYDVGDLITVNIRKAGYKVFSCKNTFTSPKLIEKIPRESAFRDLYVDRTFDDNNDVFFLHLGRGIVKSEGLYKNEGKTTPKQWLKFAQHIIVSDSQIPKRLSYDIISPKFSDIRYSMRRYFIDEFLFRKIRKLEKNKKVLDMGGKKLNKRGQFDIEGFSLSIKYVNIDPSTDPDYLCDASNIPVEDNYFDVVICSEVLEHVKDPASILKEAFRVLHPRGQIFLTVPFLFRIHPDPQDYARYTDQYLKALLKDIGFSNILIEKQGIFPSVFIEMIRGWTLQIQKEGKYRLLRKLLSFIVIYGKRKALDLEQRDYFKYHGFFTSFTTGYGVIAIK